MEDLSQSSDADHLKAPLYENRKQCRSCNRMSDQQNRLEEAHCDKENEQNQDENSIEISLRMMDVLLAKHTKKSSFFVDLID